jgi:hypothetical protein
MGVAACPIYDGQGYAFPCRPATTPPRDDLAGAPIVRTRGRRASLALALGRCALRLRCGRSGAMLALRAALASDLLSKPRTAGTACGAAHDHVGWNCALWWRESANRRAHSSASHLPSQPPVVRWIVQR